ncbi:MULTISPECIES: multiheme c-type cytochrome [Myxococcaceae]|uniref:multiheme c-type cytochrome n=1 Tax=Myxococcaceae TaxID=31 RepID=UPI001890A73B|nr:cytochrome C [Simulacricoccus sp. 17bor-14]
MLALGVGMALAASAPKPPSPAPGAVLLLSADLRGYLAPCGCSENMRGGIARAAQQVADARKGPLPVLYVDGGDSLFGSARLTPAQVPQEEKKARTLAEAMRRMGLAVRAGGELDEARGAAFRQGLKLPELAPGGVKLLPAGGRQLAFVRADSAAQLERSTVQARAQGADFVVALFHGTLEAAARAAAAPGHRADLVLATHTEDELKGEENRRAAARVPVVQLQSKGRSLLRVDLSYGPARGPFSPLKGQEDVEREVAGLAQRIELLDADVNQPGVDPQLKKLKQAKVAELVQRRQQLLTQPPPRPEGQNAFTLRFLPLESSLPSEAGVAALVAAYDREVGQLNLAWAKAHGEDCPRPAKGQAAFVGNAECQSCHAEAFSVYTASKHAHAWETLEAEGKQFHLNCVTCHVTGSGQPGGVCRLDKVKGREDVGCESCHGPGSLHAEDPSAQNIRGRPGREVCVTCHNPENSPHFDFATYLPRVLGPGHGQPAAKRP